MTSWDKPSLWFRCKRVETTFLKKYYRYLPLKIISCTLLIGFLYILALGYLIYLSFKGTTTIIIINLITTTLTLIVMITSSILLLIPQIRKRPRVVEFIVIMDVGFFLFIPALKPLWDFAGPSSPISAVLLSHFLFRMRWMPNMLLGIMTTIVYGISTLIGPHAKSLSQSSIPYLDIVMVAVMTGGGAICVYFLEQIARKRFTLSQAVEASKAQTEQEVARTQLLLENILPKSYIERAKKSHSGFMNRYDSMGVLFSDLVNFTSKASQMTTMELFSTLNRQISAFDEVSKKLQVEKVKTIGDSYFCVSYDTKCPAKRCLVMAKSMLQELYKINEEIGEIFEMRIGIAVGEGALCVMGHFKMSFDAFGPVVEEAKCMENTSKPNKIRVTQEVAMRSQDLFEFEEDNKSYLVKRCIRENFIEIVDYLSDIDKVYPTNMLTSGASGVISPTSVDRISSSSPDSTYQTLISFPNIVTPHNWDEFTVDLTQPSKMNQEAYYKYTHTPEMNIDDEGDFIISKPKYSYIFLCFKTLIHNHSYLKLTTKDNQLISKSMGFLTAVMQLFTIIYSYNVIYFKNHSYQWMYTYGLGLFATFALNCAVSLIYLIEKFQQHILFGMVFQHLLFIINWIFHLILIFPMYGDIIAQIVYSSEFATTSILMAAPLVSFQLKAIYIIICFAVPICLTDYFQDNHVSGSTMFDFFTRLLLKLIVAYGIQISFAQIYKTEAKVQYQVKVMEAKYDRNQKLLYSSLPPSIVDRLQEELNVSMSGSSLLAPLSHYASTIKLAAYLQNDSNLNIDQEVIFERESKPNSHLEYRQLESPIRIDSTDIPNKSDITSPITNQNLPKTSNTKGRSIMVSPKSKKNQLLCDDIPHTNVMFVQITIPTQFDTTRLGIIFLNDIYGWFDLISEAMGITKIKSIGFTYIVMSHKHEQLTKTAILFRHISYHLIKMYQRPPSIPSSEETDTQLYHLQRSITSPTFFLVDDEQDICIRIGLQCGPVSAGVLGSSKYLYDIFGDTVNVASRMCTLAEPNQIQMTAEYKQQLPISFQSVLRTTLYVKGKGEMSTYYLKEVHI